MSFREFWSETFFSYLEDKPLYVYCLEIAGNQFKLFSDQVPTQTFSNLEHAVEYGKILSLEDKQSIGKPFGELVCI